MSHHSPGVTTTPHGHDELILHGCLQGFLGLVLGGVISFELVARDPFGVVAFRIPQGVDAAQVAAEFERWRGSFRVLAGQFAMTLIPLLASGACGVFFHRSRPASVPAALLRMTGVALLLLAVSTAGSRAIDRALSTGESSDLQTPFAMLAFEALCVALAAPLCSAVIRRGPRGVVRDASEGPRQAPGGL